MACEDHTVTHQVFEVWACRACSGRFTQDVPDAGTIGPFYSSEAYISHSDTSKGLISKLYKTARRFTLRSKQGLLQKLVGKGSHSLLDVGCGTGAFAHTMQQAGWQVTALEPDEGARNMAAQLYGLHPQTAEQLYHLPASRFDAITLWHVLEHIHDLHGYFKKFGEILKPNGSLVIAVPNYTSTDAAHYDKYWAAYDVPRHLYHFSPESLRQLARLHGFEVVQTKAMWLDAFYIAMLSEQYMHGGHRLVSACWQGMRSLLQTISNREKASSVIYVLRKKG